MNELVHMLDATKDVQTFFVFFIPGFISLLVSGMIGPVPESDFAKRVVAAVGYSALNFGAMSAVLGSLDALGLSSGDSTVRGLFLYVFPFAYPFILYRMREKQRFGFSTPFPSTWDQFFARRTHTFFVRAQLKGDKDEYVHGLYGKHSLSSQAPAEQMLFLERVYSVDEKGEWTEHADTAGILLPMSECRTLEFFIPSEE
jgi:hypothetical protein